MTFLPSFQSCVSFGVFSLTSMLTACGAAADSDASRSPSGPSSSSGERVPGWYDVPVEPAASDYGQVSAQVEDGALVGAIHGEDLPRDQRLYLAVKWGGASPRAITDLLGTGKGVSFRASLGCSDANEGADGTLLVYLAPKGATSPDPGKDELIAASSKRRDLFGSEQRAYDQRISREMCSALKAQLLPLPLQRDPRLPLALCEEPVSDGRACGQIVLDKTRLVSASAQASPNSMKFAPTFVLAPSDGQLTVEVNGIPLDTVQGIVSMQTGRGPFHAGENNVRVTAGRLPSWEAKLVLPESELRPSLRDPGLRMGDSFTIDWAANSWANRFVVQLWPLGVPPVKAGAPSFDSEGSFVTGLLEGWDDGSGGKRTAPQARVNLEAWRGGQEEAREGGHKPNRYRFRWTETITVDVRP